MSKKARLEKTEILSRGQYPLKKVTFEYLKNDGTWQKSNREAYEIGDATTALLYNKELQNVILTRQFRLPTFINGNPDGMLIESCAGKLDGDSPEQAIKREIEEETGYKIAVVHRIFEAYMTPGSVTELVYFFTAEYSKNMKVNEGGGLKEEQEEVEVLELSFEEALQMLNDGRIRDAKTILLLQYAKLHNLI